MSILPTILAAYLVVGVVFGVWVAAGTHHFHWLDAFFTVFFVGTLWPLAIVGAIIG
jgi:hypothetical protein